MKQLVVHNKVEPFDVLIDRRSKWGNPYKLPGADTPDSRKALLDLEYRPWLLHQADLLRDLGELRGKVLGCWCAPRPCHGHVLARYANVDPDGPVVIVTGSRDLADAAQVGGLLSELAPALVLHGASPLCPRWPDGHSTTNSRASMEAGLPFCGADGLADVWCRGRAKVLRFWPWTGKWGKGAYLKRNAAMMAYGAFLQGAGFEVQVLAFPQEKSRGTWHAVECAKAEGLDVKVFD